MIGWRVGWVIGPPRLLADVARVSISNVVCQTGIAMQAVAEAIRDPDEFVWAIPSGGVGEGETEAEAALRELEEETGYRAREAREILSYYPSYGCGNQRFVLFVA